MTHVKTSSIINIMKKSLSLLDNRIMNHGEHVAYILYKMLKSTGRYSIKELQKFVVIALLHDVGAYKTDEIDEMLRYDTYKVWSHSVYGYLYLKYLSPLDNYASIILYHHLNYDKYGYLESDFHEVISFLNVADRVDVLLREQNGKFPRGYLERFRGIKFSPEALDIFYNLDNKFDITTSILNNTYTKEFDAIIEEIRLTEDENMSMLKFLVYSIDFLNPGTTRRTIITYIMADGIARLFTLTEKEVNDLRYAALFHDLGMLAIPHEIIDAPRKLTDYEMKIVKTHVSITEEVIKEYISNDITKLAVRHHEKIDGSGYPQKIAGKELTISDRILTISDIIAALATENKHKEAFDKNKIIETLQNEVSSGKLDSNIVEAVTSNYDELFNTAKELIDESLKSYWAIKEQYGTIIKRFDHFN